MVTISIIGVDPYLVRQISKAMTDKISNIYEISKDDVNFYAPECLYIHDGVEQNTWNVLVKVNAPIKAKIMEKDAVKIIREFMKGACIHVAIEFYYYSQDNRYEFIDETHPHFMTEENLVYEDDDYDDESEEGEEEELYLENMFENFEEKLKGK